MKLKVTTTYHDRKEDIDIAAGTIIERAEERAKVLIGAKVAEEYVEETAEEVSEEDSRENYGRECRENSGRNGTGRKVKRTQENQSKVERR